MKAESSSSPDAGLNPRAILVLALAVSVSIFAYLLASRLTYRIGFPLDDAWIHQTYARNLALRGEWAFIPGQPSGGSTSPLWSLLLAIGYLLGLAPYAWTFLLGALTLWALAILGEWLVRSRLPEYRPRLPWVGMALAAEWHLVWAAASGMETLLQALLVTLVLGLLMNGTRRYLALGLLAGLDVWVRPDGLTLLAPIGLVILLCERSCTARLSQLLKLALGFGALFAPYLLFNLRFAHTPWPTTFYAKQAEYSILLDQPLWQRLANQGVLPLVGVGAVLLPGVVGLAWLFVRNRSWNGLAGMGWLLGYLTIYAVRLPVTYQHGRYAMPAMPIFFLWGLIGLFSWRPPAWLRRFGEILPIAWRASSALILLMFLAAGARSYGQDVAVIESEMVATAASHLPPGALVAAHDIGALGYFGGHAVIDLAGLISPDVIPFIRNESRLAAYLDRSGAGYLITFPGWYPALVRRGALIFTTQAPFAPQLGGENMAIYRWQPAK